MIFLLLAFLSAHNNYPIIFTIDSQQTQKKKKKNDVCNLIIFISLEIINI